MIAVFRNGRCNYEHSPLVTERHPSEPYPKLKTRLFITYFSVTLAFWNLAQRMALIYCYVQCKISIGWANKIDVINEGDFTSFEFKMDFEGIPFTAMGQYHKSHNALAPYPTILHSEKKYAHFRSECYIVGYWTGAFWDCWDWSKAQEDKSSFPVLSTRKLPDHEQNPLVILEKTL